MRIWSAGIVAVLAGCCFTPRPSEDEVTIRKQEKLIVAKSGFLPGRSNPPAERNGISAQDTGAILFICANSGKHEDREVLISTCPQCSEKNYFYFDHAKQAFVCYACETVVPDSLIKCDLCGKAPKRVRTKNAGNGN